jgi:hypothetical protein
MKKQTKRALDPAKIFVHAERFRFADERLRSPISMGYDPRAGSYIAGPSLVLSAFASELYMKCLLCLEGRDIPPSHNLKKLFGRLPGRLQRRLDAMWIDYVPTRAEMFEYARKHFNYTAATDLRSALADGGTGFEDMRYVYEGPTNTKFFLADLPKLLRALILEQKPDWQGLGPTYGPLPLAQDDGPTGPSA